MVVLAVLLYCLVPSGCPIGHIVYLWTLTVAVSRLFVELLGRFELPTSSLPSVPDNLFVLLFVHVFSKTAYFLQTFICK